MAFSFRVGTNWCHDFPKLARESGFYFNMHKSKIRVDWNRISNIDIERVIRERDFWTVDENVNNVIDYCLESEYDIKILDPGFVKLFRLAQLAVEYLLYCKQYLDHSVVILKDELKSKIEDNIRLKKQNVELEDTIDRLKERLKERSKTIETKVVNSNGEIHKCPHCPKTFVSATFVTAHVARRHSYISELSSTMSPVHEMYRVETEKLYNEIKTLKERVNQTEKVIGTEGSKLLDKTKENNDKNLSEHNADSVISDSHKMCREDINSLKSILFNEIKNLRQRELSVQKNISDTDVQALLSKQEREFSKLKNQLFERLTPDLENVQEQLGEQERHWKSKLELLESEHRKDIERLTAELKSTQQAANQVTRQYETKVSDLEWQTVNQSKVLLEQKKQLHDLSRELNSSKNQFVTGRESISSARYYQNGMLSLVDNVNFAELNQQGIRKEERRHASVQAEQVFVEESSNGFCDQSNCDNHNNSKSTKSAKGGKDESTTSQISEFKQLKSKVIGDKLSRKNNTNTYTHLLEPQFGSNSRNEAAREENLKVMSSANLIENGIDNADEGSRTTSESLGSSSIESDTESIITVKRDTPLDKKMNVLPANKPKRVVKRTVSKSALKKEILEAFEKKLKSLGIDPEWERIPRATFKQKMDIVQHHRNIAAKKSPKYGVMRSQIIEELHNKLRKKGKRIEYTNGLDKSRVNRDVKSAKIIVKAFRNTKDPVTNPVPTPKSRILTTRNENGSHLYQKPPDKSEESLNHSTEIYNTVPNEVTMSMYKSTPVHHIKEPTLTSTPRTTQKIEVEPLVSNQRNDSTMDEDFPKNSSATQKQNKSVLRSVNGAASNSATKKKVIFDLRHEKNEPEELVDVDEEEENRDSDFNITSISDESERPVTPEKNTFTGNIVLKTSQSDKIAEISRKIEQQLSIARQQPVGSVETIFSSIQPAERRKPEIEAQQTLLTSAEVVTEATLPKPTPRTDAFFPQTAPRQSQFRVLHNTNANIATDDYDLSSDIDEILRTE